MRSRTPFAWLLLLVLLVGLLPFAGSAASAAPPTPFEAPTAGASVPLWGPRTFTRGLGQPQTETVTFVVPTSIGAPFTLLVTNGAPDGRQRVASATIVINGQTVVRQSDLPARLAHLERPLTLNAANDDNTLALTLAGQPGAFLSIEISGTPTGLPAVSRPVVPSLSAPLATMPAIPPVAGAPREIPIDRLPNQGPLSPPAPTPKRADPLVQVPAIGPTMAAPLASFEGGSNNANVWPPDTVGAVGPRHYVQWVNIQFTIYDKSGQVLFGPAAGNTLWQGVGGVCETTNQGDPMVLYDRLAGRWIMSQFAFVTIMTPTGPANVGPFMQCLAISTSDDPLGAYYRYAFTISQTKINDYPKLAVWPDGYYLSINQFRGTAWAGAGAIVFERERMLAGQPARLVYHDLEAATGLLQYAAGMLPADLDGDRPPPAGQPSLFVDMHDDRYGWPEDRIHVYAFHVDWTNPLATSTFTGPLALPTAPFDSLLCGGAADCLPQRGTPRRLDALADRLMFRLQYRNFGDHEALVTNHTVDASGLDQAGIRWYELRRTAAQGWHIHQQGTYAPDSDHRWMASAALDSQGNLAIGYSVSGPGTFPAIRYAGRQVSAPLNTLPEAEATLVAGGGAQTGTSRWGDYSALTLDPTDDCTFWYTQEYYAANSATGWRTRVGSFRFPRCGTRLYVVNQGDDTLSALDPGTLATLATSAVGSGPHGVAVARSRSRAYITNSSANTLSVINTTTNAVVATIPVGQRPLGVAINPAGTRVYVTNSGESTISVIDTVTNSVVATIFGNASPTGIVVHPDGSRIYVAHPLTNAVTVISAANNGIMSSIPVSGEIPLALAISPDGARLVVGLTGSFRALVVDTATNQIVASVPVGSSPPFLPAARVPVSITPLSLSIDPSGTRAYLADSFSGTVSGQPYASNRIQVIDLTTNQVIAHVPVGALPAGVAHSADGRLFVTNRGDDTISVINTSTLQVIGTIPVGHQPMGVALLD